MRPQPAGVAAFGRNREALAPTATVIGMFEDGECSTNQIQLAPGDPLAVFSDGATEAGDDREEFGEDRLIEVLQTYAHLPPEKIVVAVLARVQEFSAGAG